MENTRARVRAFHIAKAQATRRVMLIGILDNNSGSTRLTSASVVCATRCGAR